MRLPEDSTQGNTIAVNAIMGIPNSLKVLWEIHCSDPSTPWKYHEVELLFDARVTGEFEVGPLSYYLVDFGEPQPGRPLHHAIAIKCFDVRHHPAYISPPSHYIAVETDEERQKLVIVPPLLVVRELAGLLSVFLRRRVWVGKITRDGDRPSHDFSYFKNKIDPILSKKTNIKDFDAWLTKVLSLSNNHYGTLMSAIELYHNAVVVIEDSPEIAYLQLVSSVEVLANHYLRKKKLECTYIPPEFQELIQSYVPSEEGKQAMTQYIAPREKMGTRFVEFIEKYLPQEFWSEENLDNEIDKHFTVGKTDLQSVLKNIYDCRSRLIHNGKPFPRHALEGGIFEWDKHGLQDGATLYAPGEALPHIRWFERVVNFCIKNYIDKLIANQ